ncbi:hypothetical protein M413DRAFT_20789 [Hebeloma cylindrosporum]|uniref:Uncharacterized protein n=1 Tax=Hebeloma cylindrosporum TaxID=76867 RepID=A0A0C2Y291_HEBCY|nr:hypothetical protein M413DRAFT_20789 [Hebeloma cylindrosporum h7]
MTRHKWTTPEQEAWLDQRKPNRTLTANNRTATVNSNGILTIKAKAQPRKLQPWQAYHALTYESRWKADINTAWTQYKNDWTAAHPNEKLPKNRFQIMIEFMKENFEAETEEMKSQCEEYRETRQREAASPDTTKSNSARNLEFQEAINSLPRTLATIGESLTSQTGWSVSILMGGPDPESDGAVVTYLSHTGKTKAGETFEKFLGKTDYDQNILVPFERFLHASFSAEDCAARSLVKAEEGRDASETGAEECEKAVDANDDEIQKKSGGKSQYEKDKEKNIAEIQGILANLDAEYPMPEGFGRKELSKAATTSPAPVPTSTSVPPVVTPTHPPDHSDHVEGVPQAASNVADNLPAPTGSASAVVHGPTEEPSPTAAATIDSVAFSPPETAVNSASTAPITHVKPGNISIPIDHRPIQEGIDIDVAMEAPTTAQKPINDENLPPWLVPMIKYLHGVAVETTWQDLVTEFVKFERGGPPTGNLPTKLRPREVSDWIRSKKKDIVPLVEPTQYGLRFMDWWTLLQPVWRKDDNTATSLVLFRNIPMGETWQGLRKGGTAGIYVVVMGLSWWIKAQQTAYDANAWSAVDDLSWVIQQMNQHTASGVVSKKRALDEGGGDKGKDQQRKKPLFRRRSG